METSPLINDKTRASNSGPADKEKAEFKRLDAVNSKSLSGDSSFPQGISEDALIGVAGEVVRTVDEVSEASREAILVQFLVAAGNYIGRGPLREQGNDHHLNEFAVMVGNTAKARKGTSWDPIRKLFRIVDQEWLNERVLSGFPSGESIISNVRDDRWTKDSSGESQLVEGVSDKRLLIQEGEFASVLAIANRKESVLSQRLRDCWDSPEVLRNSGKTSPETATKAHISVIGHITKRELLDCMKKVEAFNGFANRFLWVSTHRSKKIAIPEPVKWEKSVVEQLRVVAETFKTERHIRFSKEAEKLYVEWYENAPEGDTLLDKVLARAEAHVLRLAMIYAVLDNVAIVKIDHLKAAIAVWDYCERSAKWIFGEQSQSSIANRILAALKAKTTGFTKTEITSDVLRGNAKSEEIDEALNELLSADLIKSITVKSRSAVRAKVIYFAPEFEDCVAGRLDVQASSPVA